MLNHILVPLDGSDLAEEAIKPAKQIVKPQGKLTLVMAIEIPQSWEFGVYPTTIFAESQKIADQAVPRAKGYLEQIAANLRIEDFQVDTLVQISEAATLILETAASHKVDAIVMSTHGRSGISRWLFGSVAEKVLSTASCPILVIPSREKERTLAELASENYVG
jgi:nucleotide-binding universal stress UspA family protein